MNGQKEKQENKDDSKLKNAIHAGAARGLERMQQSQSFLLDQVGRIPQENELIAREIEELKEQVHSLQHHIEVIEAEKKSNGDLISDRTKANLATPLLKTSIENIQQELAYNEIEVDRCEKDFSHLEKLAQEKQAILDRSHVYYEDVLKMLGIEGGGAELNFKHLRESLVDGIDQLKNAERLRRDVTVQRTTLQQCETAYAHWKTDYKKQFSSLKSEYDDKKRANATLRKKQTTIEKRGATIQEEVQFLRDKLRYLTSLPDLEDLQINALTAPSSAKSNTRRFKSSSLAYLNFDYMDQDEAYRMRYDIESLETRKIELGHKLQRVNTQLATLREEK